MRIVRHVILASLLAAPAAARADDCAAMSLFHQGAHQVRTTSNDKGKVTGTNTIDVTAVAVTPAATTATVHATSTDDKGKDAGSVDYTITCADGAMRFDMTGMFPSGSTEAYQGWTVTAKGDDLGYPAVFSPGLALPDATMTMTFTMPDAPPMIPATVLSYTAKNRVVDGPEPVTTAAGAFATWKVKYDTAFVTKGIATITMQMSVIEWFVPGVGAVKSELWRKGKLEGTTVLTESR